MLTEVEKKEAGDILIEDYGIFARHRMDIGKNTEFEVKLTPKNEKTVHSENLPMPIHLKEDLNVKLTLMHKYGMITVLPISDYASLIFAQRKLRGKLRLLLDLKKIKSLIEDDYTNNNQPVRRSRAFGGSILFLQARLLASSFLSADEMLAFNFASSMFAYKRLAQAFSRSVSTVSSFMQEYLDQVVRTHQCAQYLADIGIAANHASNLTLNVRAVFECIRKAVLKLTKRKLKPFLS